jgi:hypothetical protein
MLGAMNDRLGWENEATSRAINAKPWEPMPPAWSNTSAATLLPRLFPVGGALT